MPAVDRSASAAATGWRSRRRKRSQGNAGRRQRVAPRQVATDTGARRRDAVTSDVPAEERGRDQQRRRRDGDPVSRKLYEVVGKEPDSAPI